MARLDELVPLGHDMSGHPWPNSVVGTFMGKRCVVVASAKCVWDDLASLGIRGGTENNGWDVLCVNDIAMHYPGRVRHIYSNQHRKLGPWCQARRETIGGKVVTEQGWGPEMSHSNYTGGQHQWPWPGQGTSLLSGVYTALGLGYNPVVICGGPLDNQPHYFEPDWLRTNFEREVGVDKSGEMMYWAFAKKQVFRGRVFSQSGRTKELLGAHG